MRARFVQTWRLQRPTNRPTAQPRGQPGPDRSNPPRVGDAAALRLRKKARRDASRGEPIQLDPTRPDPTRFVDDPLSPLPSPFPPLPSPHASAEEGGFLGGASPDLRGAKKGCDHESNEASSRRDGCWFVLPGLAVGASPGWPLRGLAGGVGRDHLDPVGVGVGALGRGC